MNSKQRRTVRREPYKRLTAKDKQELADFRQFLRDNALMSPEVVRERYAEYLGLSAKS
jgi:hypothetical protein